MSGRHAAPVLRRAGRVSAVLVAAALTVSSVAFTVARAPEASAAATPYLPFDLAPASSPRLVLAHYVPWFPVSFDNKAEADDLYTNSYLDPQGEGGKHAAYGGYLRDRPLVRPVSTDPAWLDADARQEVRDAIAAGIDGFAVDVPSVNPAGRNWAAVTRLLRAAHDVDPRFRVLLQPDMVALAAADSATLATAMAALATYSAAMHLPDGRLVVSPYFAEKRSVAWWTDWMASMSADKGIGVALFPVLQDDLTWGDDFASISMGIGNWGSRNPAWNSPTATGANSPRGRIAAAHARGDLWMQPVAVQDERPRSGLFDEAANTQNLRDTWQVARDGGADWVLLPTWNDYAEGTSIAPSERHGHALLDLMAYYASWFKSGQAPNLVRDAVYLTHRTQLASAAPQYPETTLMTLRGGTPARDSVEALAFLTAPATVSITVGGVVTTCSLPAGVGTCTAPLRAGTVSSSLLRNGAAVVDVVSPYTVTATPYVQDLQYVAVSSLRSGTTSAAATTPTTAATTPAPAPTTSTPPPATTTAPAPATTSAAPPPTASAAPVTTTPAAAPTPTPSTVAPAPSTSTATGSPQVTLAPLPSSLYAGGIAWFQVTVLPADSAGLLQLTVDGQGAGAAWTPSASTYQLGTGTLTSGRHTVVATFTPTNASQPSLRSAPYVLSVP